MGLCRNRIAFLFLCLLLSFVSPSMVCAQTYIFGRADFLTGNEPRGAAVGDLNGDGIPDLVIANSTDNTISVLLGKADGTFQIWWSPMRIAPWSRGRWKIDLATANANDNTVSILLGNVDGTFQPQSVLSIANGGPDSVRFIVAADFNGDSKLDLVVVNLGTISIFLGNGDGTFRARSPQQYPTFHHR